MRATLPRRTDHGWVLPTTGWVVPTTRCAPPTRGGRPGPVRPAGPPCPTAALASGCEVARELLGQELERARPSRRRVGRLVRARSRDGHEHDLVDPDAHGQ